MSMKNSLFIFFDIYGTLAGFYPEREKIQTKILIKYNITLTENQITEGYKDADEFMTCLLYTSPSPRDRTRSRMPSSA